MIQDTVDGCEIRSHHFGHHSVGLSVGEWNPSVGFLKGGFRHGFHPGIVDILFSWTHHAKLEV